MHIARLLKLVTLLVLLVQRVDQSKYRVSPFWFLDQLSLMLISLFPGKTMDCSKYSKFINDIFVMCDICLQCFDAVGLAAGTASGL